jgi:hypothetical protein
MALNPEQKTQVDDALMESLLHELFHKDSTRDAQRIAQLVQRMDESHPVQIRPQAVWFRRRSFIGLAATAAMILVGIFLLNYLTDNAAYASLSRSISASQAKRFYTVKMIQQAPLWGQREIGAEVYLDDQDRFVVKHPGWAGIGPIWIGGNPKERWIVPFRGPAVVGGESTVGGWLAKKDIPSPYLHVTTILHRMSRAYHLELLPDESIRYGDSLDKFISCQHIRGTLDRTTTQLPVTIELWADAETGTAQRVLLIWNREPNERGPLKWELNLAPTPELPENWFTVEGHIRPNSRIIRIQSASELDALEGPQQ